MVTLRECVRMVLVQFSFTNVVAIPEVVKRAEKESPEEHKERKTHSNGKLVIEPTAGCGLFDFPRQLEQNGFELVDAFYKERIDPKDPRQKRTYHMVRFIFARKEFATLNDEFLAVRAKIRFALQTMAEDAMWRVRAFDNPFFSKGEEVDGQRALSVNLEARDPIVQPDGQPVKRWKKMPREIALAKGLCPLSPNASCAPRAALSKSFRHKPNGRCVIFMLLLNFIV